MSNIIIRPKDRTEWLKCRENGIGSSEVGTILGLNPFETPYQLWRRKLGIDPPKEENFAMKAGYYLEPAVADFWQEKTGRQIIKSSVGDWIIMNTEKPYLKVSPDRTFWTGEGRGKDDKGILECKTTQRTINENDIPKHWFCQVQYQLGVAEIEQGSIGWLTQGREFGYKDLNFVPDFYKYLIEEIDKFWKDNIIGKQEPNADSVADVLLKYNRHIDCKDIEVGEDIYHTYEQLKGLKDELDAIEERKKELEDKLKMCFGDAESISYNGRKLATWKATKDKDKFDSKTFSKNYPDLYTEFCSKSPGPRKLILK